MTIASIFATAAVAIGLSMSGAAVQSAYAAVDGSGITCADFLAMSPADQQAGFEAVKAAMAPMTLSTGSANQTKGQSGSANSMPVAPTVGAMVSACQADPSATVMDASMKAMGIKTTTSSN